MSPPSGKALLEAEFDRSYQSKELPFGFYIRASNDFISIKSSLLVLQVSVANYISLLHPKFQETSKAAASAPLFQSSFSQHGDCIIQKIYV